MDRRVLGLALVVALFASCASGQSLWDRASDAISSAADTVGDAVGSAADTVGDALGTAANATGNFVSGVAGTVGDAIGTGIDAVGGAVDDAKTFLNGNDITPLVPSIKYGTKLETEMGEIAVDEACCCVLFQGNEDVFGEFFASIILQAQSDHMIFHPTFKPSTRPHRDQGPRLSRLCRAVQCLRVPGRGDDP